MISPEKQYIWVIYWLWTSHSQNVVVELGQFYSEYQKMSSDFTLKNVIFFSVSDEYGRQPDLENTHVIQQMLALTDVPSFNSFLELISYHSVFLSSLHQLHHPPNHLLGENILWTLTKECNSAVCESKSPSSSNMLLTHYIPKLPIILTADTSSHSVGAVITYLFLYVLTKGWYIWREH